MVSKDQLLWKDSEVTLINETTQRYQLALIDIDCPIINGQTEALCMKDTRGYQKVGALLLLFIGIRYHTKHLSCVKPICF